MGPRQAVHRVAPLSALAAPMIDPHVTEFRVGCPGVCMDGGFLRPNRTMNERREHRSRCAGNHGQPSRTRRTASALDNNGDSHFPHPTALPTWAIASDIGLVGLDIAS